nr:2S albumin large chain (1 and 2) nII - rape (fragments) [Brassica napus]
PQGPQQRPPPGPS